tara:strand:+ start:70 stop:318 length:249 start_codon:yes stop_codon:yes gene_type:complete
MKKEEIRRIIRREILNSGLSNSHPSTTNDLQESLTEALHQALNTSDVVGRSELLGDTDYCNSCHKHIPKGFCNSFNCRYSKA